MMDVTFVLEESGVTATVEVPCEADVAAAKEVACAALAVSPASVEMRIGTQVLEGTCRLQDTAFDAGVQVVLARPCFADIKCPAEYTVNTATLTEYLSLSLCGTLCVYGPHGSGYVGGFDTETFETVFSFKMGNGMCSRPAISPCKTRCYLACWNCLLQVALPGGEVLREVDGLSAFVFARGGVVVSRGRDGVSVYDEDLTLLRFLSCQGACRKMEVSRCGGWVVANSYNEGNVRLWDVNTGASVACVPVEGWCSVALSRSASVFAVGVGNNVHLYDWSGAALHNVDVGGDVEGMRFTPCGKYLVVAILTNDDEDDEGDDEGDDASNFDLHQYDVATMSCVRVIPQSSSAFAISPCSRVVVDMQPDGVIVTRHLYPHTSEPTRLS